MIASSPATSSSATISISASGDVCLCADFGRIGTGLAYVVVFVLGPDVERGIFDGDRIGVGVVIVVVVVVAG